MNLTSRTRCRHALGAFNRSQSRNAQIVGGRPQPHTVFPDGCRLMPKPVCLPAPPHSRSSEYLLRWCSRRCALPPARAQDPRSQRAFPSPCKPKTHDRERPAPAAPAAKVQRTPRDLPVMFTDSLRYLFQRPIRSLSVTRHHVERYLDVEHFFRQLLKREQIHRLLVQFVHPFLSAL